MIEKKNRTTTHVPMNAVLNCDDRKKFSAFVALLVQINKRINADEYADIRNCSKKAKRKGSQNGEPLQFDLRQAFFLISYALSLMQHFKLHNLIPHYDRHRCITSLTRFVPNY
jgi:hypothetical protein